MADEPPSSSVGPWIIVAVEDDRWLAAVPDIEDRARRVCAAALGAGASDWEAGAVERMEVSLLLTDDAQVQQLNRDYRGKDKPTNVLSFAAMDDLNAPLPEDGPILLGDVILAYDICVAEAAREHKTITNHLSHLLVHGVLHLLGFDHEEDGEAEEMEGMEVAILAALGVPDPYGEPAEEHGGKI